MVLYLPHEKWLGGECRSPDDSFDSMGWDSMKWGLQINMAIPLANGIIPLAKTHDKWLTMSAKNSVLIPQHSDQRKLLHASSSQSVIESISRQVGYWSDHCSDLIDRSSEWIYPSLDLLCHKLPTCTYSLFGLLGHTFIYMSVQEIERSARRSLIGGVLLHRTLLQSFSRQMKIFSPH